MGTRFLPGIEGRVRRRSFRAGWQRLTARTTLGAAVAEGGYLLGWEPDATVRSLRSLWENRDQALAALETGAIGAASTLAVGGVAYGLLTRKRREFMREWVRPPARALAKPLGMSELTGPRRYLHTPRNFSDDDAEIPIDAPGHLRFNENLVADLVVKKIRPGERFFHLGPRRQGHPRHRQETPDPAQDAASVRPGACARSSRRCPSPPH
ncbi:hypothetical protein [Streptomyces sp. CB01580]|uniref:hypothetical protein n=1 Tax=Streptomyces sp. CB01580 TaxID=1703933 RepID=UPI00093C1F17|nr:hypothetical protein [Streptomyces sp. CB01580]